MTPMPLDLQTARDDIRAKVVELARRLGTDARGLGDGDLIPERAGLDSAAIMELIVWFEERFGVTVDEADLTIEQFGTVQAMAGYLDGRTDR
jgi:acyl carrier protein